MRLPDLPRVLSDHRPSPVRLRLALLYGGLFVVSGLVLLTITYLLVSDSPRNLFLVKLQPPDGVPPGPGGGPGPAGELDPTGQQLRDAGARQHELFMHDLLVRSGIALAIMAVISIGLGWLVAGRILRPLRTMTTKIHQISARNLHERLAADGPRDEIKDLSDTVDGLLERLETALGAQQRVVANAAHELRTPLTLEHALLEETLTDPDATVDSFRTTFERLLVLCRHQGHLLESLLTLAGSEGRLQEREPVDLSATAELLALDLGTQPHPGVRLRTRIEPAHTCGNPALVERLVGNLLDNAAGYNRPGGWVELVTGTRDGRAFVRVANTGPAVPAEQVDRLFEPFQRLDRTSGQEGHHGLGLSIVRAIATAHDAVIEARARAEGGLCVEVGFPSTAVAPSDPRAVTARGSDGQGRRDHEAPDSPASMVSNSSMSP